MNENQIAKGILKAVLAIAGIVLVLFLLWKLSSLVLYILIAAVISLVGRPLVVFFNTRLKLPSSLSAALVILLFVLLFLLVIFMIVPLFVDQFQSLLKIDKKTIEDLIIKNLETFEYLTNIDIVVVQDALKNKLEEIFNLGKLTYLINNIFNILGSIGTAVASVLFISFFFLKDRLVFLHMILALVPTKDEKRTEKVLDEVKILLQRYFLGLMLQLIVMFFIYTGILSFFDIKYAMTIALICAFLNLIPYVGPVIGFLIIIGLSLNSLFGIGEDLIVIIPKLKWIAILYFIGQLIDNYINQPIIYSKSVKSHPLEIFIVTITGGLLYGIVGVFLAIPCYTILRVILKEFFSEFKVVKSITKDI